VLLLTQAGSLDTFYGLAQKLTPKFGLDRIGFLVSDEHHYRHFVRGHPALESGAYGLVQERQVVRAGRQGQPDVAALRAREAAIGDSVLWNVTVADRRLCMGPLSAVPRTRSRISPVDQIRSPRQPETNVRARRAMSGGDLWRAVAIPWSA
jgi:hypothetical protein